MSRIIYKKTLRIEDRCYVSMQQNSTVVHAEEQDEEIVIWYLCNSEEPKVQHLFSIQGTGWPLPEFVSSKQYFRTVQMKNGLVWHIFDLGEQL